MQHSEHDLPQYTKKDTVNVVAGKATFPVDMKRIIKLFQLESGVITKDFVYQIPTDFDILSESSGAYFTQDYDEADSTVKFFFKPVGDYDLTLRYCVEPTLIQNANGQNDLDTIFDNYICHQAASNLLSSAGRYEESQLYERKATKYLKDALGIILYPGGRKQTSRFRSYYEFNNMF